MDTLCEFNNSVILTAASGGGTWSGNGIIDGATGEFAPYVAGPGTHTITYNVTDGNGCSSVDTEDIVVTDAPEATITPVDPFCIYDASFDLEASAASGTWLGNGIMNVNTGLFDPAVAGLGRHPISFTTDEDANGCFGTDTMEVAVVDIPSAEFLTSDSSWCEQENNLTTAEILITGTDSSTFDLILDIQGDLDTIHVLSNGIREIQLDNQPGENRYALVKVIEYHGNSSCERALIDALIMQVNPVPVITLDSDFDDFCSPVEVNFTAVEGYNSYSWDFGDGHTKETSNNTVSHTYTYDYTDNILAIVERDTIYDLTRDDTLFSMRVVAGSTFGCTDSLRQDFKIYPSPVADFHVSPQIQAYPDSVIFLINLTSIGNWSYTWDFGDSTSSFVEDPNQHFYDSYGLFDIQLKAYSDFCADSITKTAQIMPPPPVALFEPDTSGCPPLDITFYNNSEYAETFIWDFDDGQFSSAPNPTHTFFDSREHNVKLAVFGLSGSDTTHKTVHVYERPQAIFDAYPREASNLKQNFKFINNSLNGDYYLWDFGDGTTSPEESPNHIYEDSGSYTITLYVWNEHDCVDTLVVGSFINIIAGEGSIDFPTAFAWNESGPTGGHWKEGEIDNTVFHPAVINAVKYRLIIYTRWGEKIFESNELYVGWDGYLESGVLAKEGVYIWKVWVTYVDGIEELKAGDITFLH